MRTVCSRFWWEQFLPTDIRALAYNKQNIKDPDYHILYKISYQGNQHRTQPSCIHWLSEILAPKQYPLRCHQLHLGLHLFSLSMPTKKKQAITYKCKVEKKGNPKTRKQNRIWHTLKTGASKSSGYVSLKLPRLALQSAVLCALWITRTIEKRFNKFS